MTPLLTACAGFLLAVLWVDLMFDTQVRLRGGTDDTDRAAVDGVAGYYRRATTTSRPMSALILVVMVTLLAALAVEAVTGAAPSWLLAMSAVCAGGPILLAVSRTVPNAVRLGRQDESTAEQIRLARSIHRDHLVCAVGILAFLVLWLTAV